MHPVASRIAPVLAILLGAACAGEPPSPDAESPPPSPAQGAGLTGGGGAAALFQEGVPFQDFLAEVDRRRETWEGNYRHGEVDPALLAEAREIPGMWRMLVVAEDWCGDSANTLPYVARLDEALENLEVRVVDSTAGRRVMEAHPTPDGRAATPTMVLLGPGGEVAGCLVEQPQPLQAWWLGEAKTIADEDARLAEKYAWYDRDAGASIIREVVDLMRGAAEGTPVCRAGVLEG